MTNSDNDDVEYCAKCGDPEFDEDGIETHADEDEYDHDFELEEDEEENDGLTMDDVKKGADTLTSVAKAVKAFKDLSKTGFNVLPTSPRFLPLIRKNCLPLRPEIVFSNPHVNKYGIFRSAATLPQPERYDFTDTAVLSRFVTGTGKILPRRITGLSAKQQRRITKMIKRSRNMLLMS